MYTRKLINCLGGLSNNLNTISNTIGNIYTTGGNVGIGTTSPSSLLHVAGSLTASSISNTNLQSPNNTFTSLIFTNISSNSITLSTLGCTNISAQSSISTNTTCSGTATITNSVITNASSSSLLSANNIISTSSTINNLISGNISSGNIVASNTIKTGSIFMWLTNTPPPGYFICDGSIKSTTEFSALYNVIGYTYGNVGGDFKLPDLRGRVPLGKSSTNSFNSTGGSETHTLSIAEMPSHQHTATTSSDGSHSHNVVLASSETTGGTPGFVEQDGSGTETFTSSSGGDHAHTFSIKTTGGGQPHNNMQPYLVVNYIIKF